MENVLEHFKHRIRVSSLSAIWSRNAFLGGERCQFWGCFQLKWALKTEKHTLMLRYDVYTLCSETMEEARLELHRTMQYQDNINTPLLVSNYIKTTITCNTIQFITSNISMINNNSKTRPSSDQLPPSTLHTSTFDFLRATKTRSCFNSIAIAAH